MDALIAFWSHALAAVAFASLLIWRVIEPSRRSDHRLLLGAIAITACWAWLSAIEPGGALARYCETARNLVWIALLHSLSAAGEKRQQGVRLVYGAVAAVIGLQLVVTAFVIWRPSQAILETADLLRMTTAAGALVLLHNLYGQAAPASRSHIRFAMIGLATMWIYDLNFFTMRYLGLASAGPLHDLRGLVVALTAPLFALSSRQDDGWRVKLSRAASFQSLSLLAICGYFVLMAIIASALRGSVTDWPEKLMVAVLAVMTLALLVILPSARARSWFKVKIAKHLFEHRYDYRSEWLRFADTLGRAGPDAPPLGQRIIKAFADIVEAPAGILIVADEAGLSVASEWRWPGKLPAQPELISAKPLWDAIEGTRQVVELQGLRGGWASPTDRAAPVPQWMLDDRRAWAGIPLAHHDRLIGFVLLTPPDFERPLDWEDFDLLRTAGRQAASALAEALGQEALAHAQRFDEFNRRFAFILHDVKNLVSQLNLVSRNAERHADNPEFRTDMIATLKSSVGKMNSLLARLAPHSQARIGTAAPQPLDAILNAAAEQRSGRQAVRLTGEADCWVIADPAALEQAVGQLVQNAMEASPDGGAVEIAVRSGADGVTVKIIDHGCGMDSEFIRNCLFEPFASTKASGFGIGAFEARSLIAAMGGQLAVDSRPSVGTTFSITLPRAVAPAAEPIRKSA
ncbi:MAG TPA: XrtA/PEP-CTERM system histidine kinase PrsK [Sphingomicrobium sp.]|nr:XrtA/PEP-CTERM system histidine kinase PrsK [Sphingomicrobium sp.]